VQTRRSEIVPSRASLLSCREGRTLTKSLERARPEACPTSRSLECEYVSRIERSNKEGRTIEKTLPQLGHLAVGPMRLTYSHSRLLDVGQAARPASARGRPRRAAPPNQPVLIFRFFEGRQSTHRRSWVLERVLAGYCTRMDRR
jgi:hypothetical protein